MGWTSYHRSPGRSDRDHLQSELFGNGSKAKILDSATVGGTFYAAVQAGDGEVWALIVLQRRTRDYYNYARKEMDETMGPGYYDCPARILDLLTSTDSKWAQQWRAKCREVAAAKAAAAKVKAGDRVRFANPIRFANGDNLAELIFVKRNDFRDEFGLRYRISGWRAKQFEVVQPS